MISLYTTILSSIIYLLIHWCRGITTTRQTPVCDQLAPGGRFTGIGVHHQWLIDKSHANRYKDRYLMYKSGSSWQFDIKFNELNIGSYDRPTIRLLDNTISRSYGSDIIKRFGPKEIVVDQNGTKSYNSYDCTTVYVDINNKTIETTCKSADQTQFKSKIQYPADSVLVFGPVPGHRTDYVYIVDKHRHHNNNNNDIKYYKPLSEKIDNQCNGCQMPDFIKDIDPDLWSLIDGIVDYMDNDYSSSRRRRRQWRIERKGFLMFFNVNSKPYYCWQPLAKPLSEMCKMRSSLQKYAIECKNIWSANWPTVPSTNDEQSGITNDNGDNSTDNTWIYILFSIIVLLIIIIVIVVLVIYFRDYLCKKQSAEGLSPDIRDKIGKSDTNWEIKVSQVSAVTQKSLSNNNQVSRDLCTQMCTGPWTSMCLNACSLLFPDSGSLSLSQLESYIKKQLFM
ncbi:uncharacterized protein LOC128956495 [Oppia nitens]|uniref:uncharacterized protein LOC128956495 n=1 Tax=Oppia nitens TaxID=1686743 RepID=UPI0023DBD87C|nr:uncharacterized protein LOC128956495 [Oppia nitens]